MGIPPTIVAPQPGEVLNSAAWGVPVTNAVNGIHTGNEIVGCILYTEASTQAIGGSLVTVGLLAPDVVVNNAGFFDDANDRLVIPVGYAGLYRLDWAFSLDSFTAGAKWRMQMLRNGNVFMSDNKTVGYGALVSAFGSAVLRLADGHTLQWTTTQSDTVNHTLFLKCISLIRIGAWAPTALMDSVTGLPIDPTDTPPPPHDYAQDPPPNLDDGAEF